MDYKIQILNGFKLYFDQISNIFKSRYDSEDKINLDILSEKTGLNRRKTRIILNFLSDIGFSEKRTLKKTELGKIIFENDCYLEDIGTLWLMHYMGSINENLIIWNRFINTISYMEHFTPEEIMMEYVELKESMSEYTYKHHVRKELSNIIDAYVNQRLSNLLIIEKNTENENIYEVMKNQEIPDLIFMATCIKFRDKYLQGATSLEIREICNAQNSPGKILFLDENAVRNKLDLLKKNRLIEIESRGDLDQIRFGLETSFEDILRKYYRGEDKINEL